MSLPLAVPAPPPAQIEPIAPELHVMRVTVSEQFKSDLEEVRDALSHKLSGAGLEELLHECIRVTLDACKRRRRGTGEKTTATMPPEDSRYIPVAIADAVWKRDGGRCAFVGSGGRRCNSRHKVQVHHRDPHGMNGKPTVENLALFCQAHNLHAAKKDYGEEHIAQAIARSSSRAREAPVGYRLADRLVDNPRRLGLRPRAAEPRPESV